MRFGVRTSLGAAGFVGIFGMVLAAIYLPLPHLVVAMLSAICVMPAVLLIGLVGARWNFGKAWRTAVLAAPLGYVLGGLLGWLCVPGWMASFWTTVDATMNAARYGSAFEYTAERVVLYVIYGGTLGSLAAALVSMAFLKRTAFRKPRLS